MFDPFFIITPIIYLAVIGVLAYYGITALREWIYNNGQPINTIVARVVTKRAPTYRTGYDSDAGIMNIAGYKTGMMATRHYVTFEAEDGTRKEFKINGRAYGLLAEGDYGVLKFQGTRYLDFER